MKVKALRQQAGMTQKAFGEYFSIPRRTLEDWESNQRSCPEYLVQLIEYKLQKEGLIQ